MKPHVFIIILNWNGLKDTVECLESVGRLSVIGYQLSVVVVDNGSTEKKFQELRTITQNLKLIENKQNLGYAGGNNVGIKYALKNGADYVLILNNDATLDSTSIIRIVKVAEKNTEIGLISPKIYFTKGHEFHKNLYKKEDLGKIIWYAGGKIDWDNVYGAGRGVDEVDRGQYDRIEETDFATGTCMLISRKVLEKIGMFDEKYFMYYEDTDLSSRAKEKGFKVVYIPDATAWHKVAQSSAIGSGLNDYFTTRNRMLFGMKYASMRTKFALLRESIKLLLNGRKWQKIGIKDFYLGRFGKGSWK